MLLYTPAKPADHVPVIDLAPSLSGDPAGSKSVAEEVHRACRDTGFLYIVNHGVSQALIDSQFAAAKAFFDLPLSDKMALHMKLSPTKSGYEPVGGQVLDSQDKSGKAAPPDLKESFYAGLETDESNPFHGKARGFGFNQWPSITGFREQTIAYGGALRGLGDHLLSLLALSLDLPGTWFADKYEHGVGSLRMIKYPPQPAEAQFNQIGAGAHTDWGGITILAQDDIGGLEVRNASDQWIQAKPVPGAFVINLGDLMARWTNGIYNSNMHRVNNNASGRDRYSIPFFYSPTPTAVIEPIPTCVTPDNPPDFEVVTAAEHMAEMFKRSYGYRPPDPFTQVYQQDPKSNAQAPPCRLSCLYPPDRWRFGGRQGQLPILLVGGRRSRGLLCGPAGRAFCRPRS